MEARPWKTWRILSLNPQTDLLGWPESIPLFSPLLKGMSTKKHFIS